MCEIGQSSDPRCVAQREVQVQVDALVDGETVSGVIRSAATPSRRFSGRLGLMAALDEALEAGDDPTEDGKESCG
jgi:hypothetical protein